MRAAFLKTVLVVLLVSVVAAGFGERKLARMTGVTPSQMADLVRQGLIVDQLRTRTSVDVWVTAAEFEKHVRSGIGISWIPNRAGLYADSLTVATRNTANPMSAYHNYTELTAFLDSISLHYPSIAQVFSIGESVQGRQLWVMKISDNADQNQPEPEFKYIANMHGDEPPGKEVCINLIRWLVLNYGSDVQATRIVDNLQLFILPSMNPDGFEAGSRFNANGTDLNRDFPDRIIDSTNTTTGREPETAAVMNWGFERNFSLSANFHSGALVANYPYDGNESGWNVYTPAPDDELFTQLATTYASENLPMFNSPYFPGGITNGADWYVIYGGMQDWNYVWMGDFDITVEIYNTKYPPVTSLPAIWNDNRESMLAYIEQAFTGIQGTVADSITGSPVRAAVEIVGIDHAVFSDSLNGFFTRICIPDTYNIEISAPGYISKQQMNIPVINDQWSFIPVELVPEDWVLVCDKGDVNQDSSVNVQDIVIIVNHILGYTTLDETGICAADWNDDDVVNVLDIVSIVHYILNSGERGLAHPSNRRF